MRSMYARKLKRPVDPNAPPRPSLLGHEKTIKETRFTIDDLQNKVKRLEQHIDRQDERIRALGNYVDQLRNFLSRSQGDGK